MKLVEVLKYFGLSEYEAKALLTLLSKGELTAKDIAELSGIPRTSVYDVMNLLESKGLVESYGKPLRFRAIEADEIAKIISGIVLDRLDLLKKELSRLRGGASGDVRVYKGEAMLNILRAMVSEAREILALLSYITGDMAKILNSAKCRLIVVSSNASRVKGECYEFPRKEKLLEKVKGLCHGTLIFDDKAAMVVFMNGITLSIVSYDERLVLFLKMLVNSLIEFFRDVRTEVSNEVSDEGQQVKRARQSSPLY